MMREMFSISMNHLHFLSFTAAADLSQPQRPTESPQPDSRGRIGLYAALGLTGGVVAVALMIKIISSLCFTKFTDKTPNFSAVVQNPEGPWSCFSCTSRLTSDLFTSQTVFIFWDKQTGWKTERTNIWAETERTLWILLLWFYKYNHRRRRKGPIISGWEAAAGKTPAA